MISCTPEAQPLPEPSSPLPSSSHHLPCCGRRPALVVPTVDPQLTQAISLETVSLQYCGRRIVHSCNTAQHSMAQHSMAQHSTAWPACLHPAWLLPDCFDACVDAQVEQKLRNDNSNASAVALM